VALRDLKSPTQRPKTPDPGQSPPPLVPGFQVHGLMLERACIVGGRGCSDGGAALPGTSRCRNHTRSNWGVYRPEHTHVYRSSEWTSARARVLREQPICAVDGCAGGASEVDHIVPLSRGGAPYDRQNLRGLCSDHHRQRSSQQGAEAKRRQVTE
jgi:5-methylcytosine-specific restriction endonuclease McrA